MFPVPTPGRLRQFTNASYSSIPSATQWQDKSLFPKIVVNIEGWWIKLGVSYLWLAAWANLESPSQKVSMRDSLLWVGLWAYWWKIVLTELIDTERSSPVLATPFPRQKVLNCLRVESSCISKRACVRSLSALWMWPAASDSCLRLPG